VAKKSEQIRISFSIPDSSKVLGVLTGEPFEDDKVPVGRNPSKGVECLFGRVPEPSEGVKVRTRCDVMLLSDLAAKRGGCNFRDLEEILGRV
jgi:hypothetical protein